MSNKNISVSVTELIEFVFATGDLALSSVGSGRLMLGAEGHRQIQKKRGDEWQNEVYVKYEVETDDIVVIVNGRIDGVFISDDSVVIEEIKTTFSNAELKPFRLSDYIDEDYWFAHKKILSEYQSRFKGHSFLHWAQALVYGYIYLKTAEGRPQTAEGRPQTAEGRPQTADPPPLPPPALTGGAESVVPAQTEMAESVVPALARGAEEIICRLNYLKLTSHTETLIDVLCTREFLDIFFNYAFEKWFQQHTEFADWKHLSRNSLLHLQFPLTFRAEQRKMAVAVYRSITAGINLYSRAPTGTGKTLAAIFPALKAMGEEKTEKIFYLTAKTIGRTVAESTIQLLQKNGAQVRYCVLTAKEKACLKDFALCDADYCEYSRDYYDKQRKALAEALDPTDTFPSMEGCRGGEPLNWNFDTIKAIAEKYQLCPFEFSLKLSEYAEIVICDYNYCFDPIIYIRRHFNGEKHNFTFLIDEAHNLVERAREMYSNELSSDMLAEWLKSFPNKKLSLYKSIKKLSNTLQAIKPLDKTFFVLKNFPADVLKHINTIYEQAERQLERKNKPFTKYYLLKIYFELMFLLGDVRGLSKEHIIYYQREQISDLRPHISEDHPLPPPQKGNSVVLKIFCLNPRDFFARYLENAKSAIFFSATLHPFNYFCEILAEKEGDQRLTLLSPFDKEKFGLYIYTGINMYYQYRESAYQPLAELILSICSQKQGNYLIYFPSFSFMNKVYNILSNHTIIHAQKPNMTEKEREAFLAMFENSAPTAPSGSNDFARPVKAGANDSAPTASAGGGRGGASLIAFAVLGGIFAEGIDLIGDKLIGTIIVSVGLPSLGNEKALIKDYYDDTMNMGFEYAYRFPGFNKVMQAAGRVIRSEQDKGFVILIDQRYAKPEYKELYPPDWQHYKIFRSKDELEKEIEGFWGKRSEE